MPVITTVPPLRIALNAAAISGSLTTPTVTIALSAPTPRVSSLGELLRLVVVGAAWVAPSSNALARLLATGRPR